MQIHPHLQPDRSHPTSFDIVLIITRISHPKIIKERGRRHEESLVGQEFIKWKTGGGGGGRGAGGGRGGGGSEVHSLLQWVKSDD